MKYITRTLKILLLMVVIPTWWVFGLICSISLLFLCPLSYPIIYIIKGTLDVDSVEDFFEECISKIFNSSFKFADKILQE